MSNRRIGRNLLANLFGQGWMAILALLVVPIYLHFLGADGFGLIGFYMTLSALMSVLDGGMGAAATRDTAMLSSGSEADRAALRGTLRSIEALFGLIAVIAGLGFTFLAPLIARHWLQVPEGRMQEMTHALSFMGGALALQFAQGFYSGCLIGLQRQVLLNGSNAFFATARSGGAALALWLVSPTASTFFAWQLVIGLASLATMHMVSWRALGGHGRVRPRIGPLCRSARFALGAGTTNLLGLVLTQLDKVLLSKLLPLQAYGYYMVAWTAGTLALRAAGPVFNAYYPALTKLAQEQGTRRALRDTYLQGASLLSVMVAPVTATLIIFGDPLMVAWTQDENLAGAAAIPLTMIALGSMGNAYMHLPYALQLAHGKTRLALTQNIIAILLLPPITYFTTTYHGLAGASASWLVLNLGYIVLAAPVAHRGLVDGAMHPWYWRCILIPLTISMLITGSSYAVSLYFQDNISRIACAIIGLMLSLIACSKFLWMDVLQLLNRQSAEKAWK